MRQKMDVTYLFVILRTRAYFLLQISVAECCASHDSRRANDSDRKSDLGMTGILG
jgi:hypothetical protein